VGAKELIAELYIQCEIDASYLQWLEVLPVCLLNLANLVSNGDMPSAVATQGSSIVGKEDSALVVLK
jgi:hypothetical protein